MTPVKDASTKHNILVLRINGIEKQCENIAKQLQIQYPKEVEDFFIQLIGTANMKYRCEKARILKIPVANVKIEHRNRNKVFKGFNRKSHEPK